MKVNPRDYGAKGDGKTDDTAAFLAARDALASTTRSMPWGVYYGGGVMEVPDGHYMLPSADLALAGVLPAGQRYGQITMRGEGRYVSVLDMGTQSLVLSDAPGANVDCHTHVEAMGVLSSGVAVRITGGGQCSVERSLVTGAIGVKDDASDMTTLRDVSFYGSGTGALAANDCNGLVVERSQFNGPSVAVWHAGGVGHVVRECNSEGAVLGRFSGAVQLVEHSGWLHEGGAVAWQFADGGAASYTVAAMGVTLRGGFTSAASPVAMDARAVCYDLTIENVSAPAASGAFVHTASPYSLARVTTVLGRLPDGVLWTTHDTGTLRDLGVVQLAGYVPGNASGNGPTLPTNVTPGTMAYAWRTSTSPTSTGEPVYYQGVWRRMSGDPVVGL